MKSCPPAQGLRRAKTSWYCFLELLTLPTPAARWEGKPTRTLHRLAPQGLTIRQVPGPGFHPLCGKPRPSEDLSNEIVQICS